MDWVCEATALGRPDGDTRSDRRVLCYAALVLGLFYGGCRHGNSTNGSDPSLKQRASCGGSPLLRIRKTNVKITEAYDVSLSCSGEVRAVLHAEEGPPRKWSLSSEALAAVRRTLGRAQAAAMSEHMECSDGSLLEIAWISNGKLVTRKDTCGGQFDAQVIQLAVQLREIIGF
jgi:hypothetical protein